MRRLVLALALVFGLVELVVTAGCDIDPTKMKACKDSCWPNGMKNVSGMSCECFEPKKKE